MNTDQGSVLSKIVFDALKAAAHVRDQSKEMKQHVPMCGNVHFKGVEVTMVDGRVKEHKVIFEYQ